MVACCELQIGTGRTRKRRGPTRRITLGYHTKAHDGCAYLACNSRVALESVEGSKCGSLRRVCTAVRGVFSEASSRQPVETVLWLELR